MMEKNIEICRQEQGISIVKEQRTAVDYFLFDTFEVHKNQIPAGCFQDWHAHQKIEEVLVLTVGKLQVEWLIAGQLQVAMITAGELVRLKNSIHRISNPYAVPAECVIFRFVPQETSQAAVIKRDKRIYTDAEIAELLQAGD